MASRPLLPRLGIWPWLGIGAAAALWALFAQADESNQGDAWPVFRGDARASGVARDALPSSERLELLWTFSASHGFKATAAIVAGTVYAADSDGNLYAIDLASGAKRWKSPTNSTITASPAVRRDRVYIGDYDGRFHCLDGKSGKVVWQFEADARIYASANFYRDCVLFGSRDAFLYCLKADSGKLVWKCESPGEICSIVVAEDRVFFAGDDNSVHIIDPRQGKSLGAIYMRWPTACVPALTSGVLFVGNEGGALVALDPRQKKILWSYETPEAFPFESSAAATPEAIFVGCHDKQIHALDPKTGRPLWAFRTKARVDSSPVVVGKRVFVGSSDGRIYGLDAKSGREVWRFEAGAAVEASPAVAAGQMVVGAMDGNLYCFGQKKR